MSDNLTLLTDVIAKAQKQGADAADGVCVDSTSTDAKQRMGATEAIEHEEKRSIGLRVLLSDKRGYKQAIVSSSDLSPEATDKMIEQAIAIAKASPADEFISLAPKNTLAIDLPELDLYDADMPSAEELVEQARVAEQAAMDVDGITNAEGTIASFGQSQVALATSEGFGQHYQSSSCSLVVEMIAGKGDAMQNDYEYAIARHRSDLQDAATIGKKAADRAVSKLNPKKVKTGNMPLIFDPRVARGLVGNFLSAINGASVARGTTFLLKKMGEPVFAKEIQIIDNPLQPRALGSRAFDGEGIAGAKRHLIKNGVLQSWLLDLRSANKLGLESTGHAARGVGSVPSPSSTNSYLEAGKLTPKELMADIKQGIYITEAFGMGVNGITGDYSQGAGGFMIENGEITHPVSEFTIAGNLLDMFQHLTPASDLEMHYTTNAPTLRVEGMMVAGN